MRDKGTLAKTLLPGSIGHDQEDNALRPLTDDQKMSAPAYYPADHGQILPFSPEGAAQRREQARRAKLDVTRSEFEDLKAEVERLASLLARLAKLAADTQKRQCEMRADLLAAGAFEKKGKIILPRDLN